jgi:hypothetical protein
VQPSTYSHVGDVDGLLRPPASVLDPSSQSYVMDANDPELRSATLEAMLALCSSSLTLAARFASTPSCPKILLKIASSFASGVSTYSGPGVRSRAEGFGKAGQILVLMFTQPSLFRIFQSIHSDFILASCNDDYVAGE